MLNRLYLGIRSIFLRGRLEREMRDEMSLHVEQATARYIASGFEPTQARKAAIREFGNFDFIDEDARDARGNRWIDALRADVRFAFRHFRRTPLSTATMIVVLSLGIGVNTALFTLLHAMRTLPPAGVEQDDSLVRVRGTTRFANTGSTAERLMSYVEANELLRRSNVFRDVAAFAVSSAAFDVGGEDGTFSGGLSYVSDNYFRVLGLRPGIGTTLPPLHADADPSAALAGVISHYLWQSRFGGSTDVAGRTLDIGNTPITIVGVAPPNFAGTTAYRNKNHVWLPLAARAVISNTSSAALTSPDSALFDVVARLQPGVSIEQASQHARTVAAAVAAQRTSADTRTESADVAPLLASNPTPNHDRTRIEEAATGGAITLLILLITCTNVSALLLGLAVARRREIAVRLSLGAARRRIIRQLLTESMCLAVAAGSLGVFLVWIMLQVLVTRIPELQELLLLDAWALLFTFGFGLATGILFGLSPALHATRVALADVLKDTAAAVSASRSWLQRGLIVAQIALTQPLLVGLGATVLVLLEDARGDAIRSDYDRIARMRIDYFNGEGSREERDAGVMRLVERIASLPGVAAAVPADDGSISELYVHPSDYVASSSFANRIMADLAFAPVGHFDLMGIPIVRGRDFTPEDAAHERSVIIASDLARDLFGNADPIGRRFGFQPDATQLTIVGVIDAAQAGSSRNAMENRVRVYVPFAALSGSVLIRTHGPAEPLIPALRAAAIAEVPDMPVWSIRTLEEIETSQRRTMLKATSAAAAGGLLALLLSAIGLYAVIAFSVGQRTREIGIRTALGAARAHVLRMFFLSGLRLAVIGLLLGLPLSLMALNVMASTFDMPRANVPVLAVLIAGAVVTVAGVATWVPARRAAGLDPLRALRSE